MLFGEQFEAPDMDAGEDRDLPAAIEREDERSGEVRAEVDLSGGNRLVRHPGIIGNDVVDLRDAFVREQFVDDISRGGAEARAPAERDFRRLGRGFLRQRAPALIAPDKSGRCSRAAREKEITPGGKHRRLPSANPPFRPDARPAQSLGVSCLNLTLRFRTARCKSQRLATGQYFQSDAD